MADIHELLATLCPTDHASFPSDGPALEEALAAALASTHQLINSVPLPSTIPPSIALPTEPDGSLSSNWKPVKINAKDNPFEISVFKLSAKDGRGAWFARRSIHTDIPFPRFQACLQREFEQSTGKDDAIRGIGKEAKLQSQESRLGNAAVYQLAAQFPAVSPREFIQGVLSSTAHAGDVQKEREGEGNGHPEACDGKPRQFTFISRPVIDHPDAKERRDYVRGQYESVEYIRELMGEEELGMKRSSSDSHVPSSSGGESSAAARKRGHSVNGARQESSGNGASAAVDWIMITRSDPGGNVPRWMVERGTPNGIVQDAVKFLRWAKNQTFEADEQGNEIDTGFATSGATRTASITSDTPELPPRPKAQSQASSQSRSVDPRAEAELEREATPDERLANGDDQYDAHSNTHGNGLLASVMGSLSGGFTSLASSALGTSTTSANPTPPESPPSYSSPAGSRSPTPPPGEDTEDDDSETASLNSFHSAASADMDAASIQASTISAASGVSSGSTTTTGASSHNTKEDRALKRFLAEKSKLEAKLARERDRNLAKERKASEKHLKEMEKRERKYRRAVEKAEERRKKEEAKRQKELTKERERLEKTRREEGKKEERFGGDGSTEEGDEKVADGVGIMVGGTGTAHVEIEDLKHVVEGLTRENVELKKRNDELEKENAELKARYGADEK